MGSKEVHCRAWHLNGSDAWVGDNSGRGCDSSHARKEKHHFTASSFLLEVLKCRQAMAEEVLTEEELGSEHMGAHTQDSSRKKIMLLLFLYRYLFSEHFLLE